MSNPLLGKIFDIPNLKSFQKIILFQIIYDPEVFRDQLAYKASCTPKTVTETLKYFKKINFLLNYDENARKFYNFIPNYDAIELAWATRKETPLKAKGKRKIKKEIATGSPVPSNEDENLCLREPRSLLEGAPFPVTGSPVHTPIYEYINNLTIDLSNTIDDRKDNLVQLVDKKIKTEEELARDWFYEQLNKMKKDNLIALEILQSKDISILFAEGMYHALNRDQAVFPKLSHALKGMMKLLVAGSWSTPTGMQKKQSVAPRELRSYDKEPRPESIVDINYKRPEEEKVSGLKNLAEILTGLRKKGGGLAALTH